MLHEVLSSVVALALTSCHFHEHVELRAPAHDAPMSERVAAYKALAPQGPYAREAFEGLRLMNGAGVECPSDLLPLVEADSRVARAARAWDEHATLADVFGWGVAAPLGVASIALIMGGSVSGDDAMATVGGVGILLTVGAAIVYAVFDITSAADKRRALSPEHYRAALRERLALCPEGADQGVCSD